MGKEMLWNVMQSVKTSISGNVITFMTDSEVDAGILDRADTKETIEEALKDYLPFVIQVDMIETINREKIDEEAEKIKKIFGDDIVIIND
jgi:hypothetical protein